MENKKTFLEALKERRLQNIENDILLSLCRSGLTRAESLDVLANITEFIKNYGVNPNEK